jgi:hypothetical protein
MIEIKTVSKAQVMEIANELILKEEKKLIVLQNEVGTFYRIINLKNDLTAMSDLRFSLATHLDSNKEITKFDIFEIHNDLENYYIDLANSFNRGSEIEKLNQWKRYVSNKFYWDIIDKLFN